MVAEISSKKWFADVSNDKNPRNVRQSPRLRVKECCPYVAIAEPLTTDSVRLSHLRRRSERVGGIMLTCAPVSTRKLSLFMRSAMCNRRLILGPGASVAANGWPCHLTSGCSCRVECTSLHCYHTFGGTSKCFVPEELDCGVDFGSGNGRVTGE